MAGPGELAESLELMSEAMYRVLQNIVAFVVHGEYEELRAASGYEVRYVLVGGLAAQAHGATRVTKDLELCPAWDSRNLELLAGALRDLGARYKSVAEDLRLPPDAWLIAGQEIGAWRIEAGEIDVLNSIPRWRTPRRVARYDQRLAAAAVVEIDGRQIRSPP